MRKIIASALQKEPSLEIVGFAANGLQAIEMVESLHPDVVTLDIEMPEMDGLSALREIRKKEKYLPVIMFSSLTQEGAQAAVSALTAGASDYVGKPTAPSFGVNQAFQILETELIPKILGLARRVQRRRQKELVSPTQTGSTAVSGTEIAALPKGVLTAHRALTANRVKQAVPSDTVSAVCIGVSTGGPMALMQLFSALQQPLAVPIFVVQHMPSLFTALLAERLNSACLMAVHEARQGEAVEAGVVYIAPGGFHMAPTRRGLKTTIEINDQPPENSCRPSVDVLFRAVAGLYGPETLAVVLTGMGSDGLKGSQVIHQLGGKIIAQDEASSVIWGMPGAVVGSGIADAVLSIDQIADELSFRCRKL
jgi:two-component system chemotaxis response regulator CheB